MTDSKPLDADERAELERLRAATAASTTATAGPRHRVRGALSAVVITLGCVLMPVAVVAVWTSNLISDTDRYVATMAPLASDPAIQNAVANRTTDVVMRQLDIQHLLPQAVAALERRGLPPALGKRLGGLSGPITSGVHDFVRKETGQVVRSDAFANLWVRGNRLAHRQVTAVLSGEGGRALSASGGTVSIDLAPVVATVKQKLVGSGLGAASAIPAVHATIPITDKGALTGAQRGYDLLNKLRWVLPVAAVVLIALGVVIAFRRRRALIGAGLGVAASMLVLGAGITIARGMYLDAIAAHHLDATAATVMFDTLVRFVRTGIRMLFVLGLVVAAGAYLAGPSRAAVTVRGWCANAIGALRRTGEAHGVSTGPVGTWIHANRRVLQVAAVAVAALVFLFWDHPTGKAVLLIAVILLAVLAVIELLGRPPAKRASAAAPSGPATPSGPTGA
ncbi:MAG TPA: hypothetical protein VGL93_27340 [Streptosporangiaceae bacterium]|jgi:hypothetical protein